MLTTSKQRTFGRLHWPLMAVVSAIAMLGCYNLHSSAAHHGASLYQSQIIWLALGAAVISITLAFDYRLTETLAYPLYAAVVSMLAAVLVFGRTVMGARRWLALGPVTFQPSELAKVAIIFCLARYFSNRSEAGGYSIRALLRPLNPSRSLGCLFILVVGWQRPWLVDPMGELARGVHAKVMGQVPQLENLLWFRLCLVGFFCLAWPVAMVLIVRVERAVALLNPWPQGRRRRLLLLVTCLWAASMVALFSAWHQPALADPFGVVLIALDAAAAQGGWAEVARTTYVVRTVLLALVASYCMASFMAGRRHHGPSSERWVAPLDLLALPALLVLVQPDLGTAGIIVLVGMSMVLVVGVRLRSLGLMGLMAAATSLVSWFGVLKDYQKRRILTFLDPEQDVRGAGWNAVQSLIAVGSGRWFGKGHMNGTQTQLSFLPEQHTDFAFSVWAEEQGFVGCTLLLALYLLLVALALRIAAQSRDTYGLLVATGATALIVWQAVINVGMVIGLLPVVGITLPLFSYGGSSAMTVLLAVGLLLNVHWRRR